MMLIALVPSALAADLLHVGNSYTFFNDLEQRTREVLAAVAPDAWREGQTTRLADGGLRFVDHRDRASTAGSPWQAALAGETDWNWVVLQEQSQLPGFPQVQGEFRQSLEAAATLDDLAEARGAQTLFLLTWGRRDGDATNAARFPDFPTMQAHLAEGYLAYRDTTSTPQRPTWIAPAGPAFARVYEAEVAAGRDPLASESAFRRLYVEDGSHPSPLGTYLTACVIAASITGATTKGTLPPAGIAVADAEWLQHAADDTVHDATLPFTYPWSVASGGGSETGTDSGDPQTEDTSEDGREPSDTSDTSGDASAPPAEGCGCTSAGPSAPLLGWLAVFAARRRRR